MLITNELFFNDNTYKKNYVLENSHNKAKQHYVDCCSWGVFERFYRSSKARAHTKGTGLGLALVKQLSSRIGANVKVESQINVGSEFFVSFQDK